MLSEQEIIRREKLNKLREYGIDPYPAALFPISIDTKKIISEFNKPNLETSDKFKTASTAKTKSKTKKISKK